MKTIIKKDSLLKFIKTKTNRDFWLGVTTFLIFFLLLIWIIPVYIPGYKTGESGLTPRVFPSLMVSVLLLLSVVLIYKNIGVGNTLSSRAQDKKASWITVSCIILFFICYFGIKIIGLLPMAIITLSVLIFLFGFKKWFLIPISIGFVLLLFLFFEKVAQVSFPRGMFFRGLY